MAQKYLVEERKGRWGKRKWVYTAFLEVTFPDGKKKIYRVKQTKYTAGAKPSPRWSLTRGQMKSLIKPTSARHWQIRMIMDSHGYPLDKKWGTPNLKGKHGVSVEWDLEHMRGGYFYDFRPKENLIHAGSSHLTTYDLRPKFPMRILPQVPTAAVRKATKKRAQEQIPRFGQITLINLWMKTQRERDARLKRLKEAERVIKTRLKTETAPSKIKSLKTQLKQAQKEIKKVHEVNTVGLKRMRIR